MDSVEYRQRVQAAMEAHYDRQRAKARAEVDRAAKKSSRHLQGSVAPRREWHEQRDVASWLGAHKIAYCAIPNGGERDPIAGSYNKAIGVKRGVPDIFIFTPPPKHPGARGIALEMKSKTGKATPEQLAWLEKLSQLGWVGYVAYGADDAIDFLKGLGFGQ